MMSLLALERTAGIPIRCMSEVHIVCRIRRPGSQSCRNHSSIVFNSYRSYRIHSNTSSCRLCIRQAQTGIRYRPCRHSQAQTNSILDRRSCMYHLPSRICSCLSIGVQCKSYLHWVHKVPDTGCRSWDHR